MSRYRDVGILAAKQRSAAVQCVWGWGWTGSCHQEHSHVRWCTADPGRGGFASWIAVKSLGSFWEVPMA
ncbi:uncharacterized protein PHACADRAFT_248880 [Phanerochaete carnosa HHB-10118-sp]|uniref:Uncharacterized protein n=1 Tax=Phanerochaete carnosa (strain HHB-10118-sp) TaxID=650164 RepID=K5WHK3_PHACS|nr:uncharacterized protein PHACADRAFT_248880 [Phanerochaete carnosa HHB-10118-sp]EKM58790.1 hypothetical protein PHACADRAFT_248880 [Phanerochaete carnosa HHB-10118-sp]